MALVDYIGHGETIELEFGISLRYMVIQTVFWGIFFGGMILIVPNSGVIHALMTLMLGLIWLYLWVIFWVTKYFVTEKKIYKKTGVIWAKLVESGKEDVTDVTIQKSILDRLIFGTGQMKLNTAGGPTIELILDRVANPEGKKKEISRIWGS